ncbi:MAG: GtrA family protein [Patescibacteria group bacterium]|nr:GtrA family protein [Patescibacteria group bacterium]MDD5121688.1 GtrA family protein [Patescibacteria group bacterium]MDD5396148.1 GtrA family protein [Patescibacteria group bacterium]
MMFKNLYNSAVSRVRNNFWFEKYPWTKQFIKFSIAGGVCAIIDFLVYIILTRLSPFWAQRAGWANFLAISLASTVNFVWNKKWTFHSNQPNLLAQYIKFWVVVILGIVVYQWIFVFSIKQFHFFDLLGKAIAAAIVWILRFIFNKFWSFK